VIVGLGLDLCDGARMRRALARHPRMTWRIFTEGESALCSRRKDPAPCFAARFAAKEAAMKALGTGWSRGIGWRDIEVVRAPGQAPSLAFHGKALERFRALGAARSVVTITHEGEIAAAVVILES
jgi:holo-[acyl-carrier protein] synthase